MHHRILQRTGTATPVVSKNWSSGFGNILEGLVDLGRLSVDNSTDRQFLSCQLVKYRYA